MEINTQLLFGDVEILLFLSQISTYHSLSLIGEIGVHIKMPCFRPCYKSFIQHLIHNNSNRTGINESNNIMVTSHPDWPDRGTTVDKTKEKTYHTTNCALRTYSLQIIRILNYCGREPLIRLCACSLTVTSLLVALFI